MMTYSVYTDLDLYCTKGIGNLDETREIAKRYAAEGHEVEIRDDETGDTIDLETPLERVGRELASIVRDDAKEED